MAYQCKDCSFTRNGAFPGGKCPACGSFNITGGPVAKGSTEDRYKRLRLFTLVGLWGYLAFLLYQKLLS